jgi:hypothetical protein
MRLGLAAFFVFFLSLTFAADKQAKPYEARTGNERADLWARVLTDPAEIQAAVGTTIPEGYIVVEARVRPRSEEAIRISPDDFTLLSHKDGQRSNAFSPSQIAGKGAMVVTKVQGQQGVAAQNRAPWFGGGASIGNPTARTEEARAEIKEDKESDQPLIAALQSKILPEKEGSDTVQGLLYFWIDGKVKKKDLTLIYKGAAGRMIMDFQEVGTIRK